MVNAKYVVMKYSVLVDEAMFIFPSSITHKQFTNDMCHHRQIISAGFVTLRDGELFCHGQSISLKIKSRPEEDGILANAMFERGA